MSAPAPSSSPNLDEAETTKIDYKSLPPVNIAIRSKIGIEFRSSPFTASDAPSNGQPAINEPSADGQIVYSNDGAVMALVTGKNIKIMDTKNQTIISTIDRPRVEHIWFSPLHTYLCTWHRKGNEDKNVENLMVWEVASGRELLKVHCNELDPEQERPIQWTFDESILGLLVTNEVKFFAAAKPVLSEPMSKLIVKSVMQFAFAPLVKPYKVATFFPSKGTDPAKVNVYNVPTAGAADMPQASASKSFFKAEEVTLKWSPTGTALLIESRTSTDKTGKSYYGESSLHLLHADGSYSGTVPFGTNPGPIQAVEWSPTGKEFMVIQGFQPAKSTLFVASNCTPIREYGTGSHNTIRWSPHGRFVMLGGFGNLAGHMEFFDHFKFKKMGSAIDRDGAKSFEWTPDGRFFITASLRPWRRVDNGYKIWTYYGEQVYAEKYDELYQVLPQPAPVGVYPNRPQSPRLTDKRRLAAASGQPAAPAQPTAYIPPHLRARGATAPSAILKRETESAPKKLNSQERAAITGEPVPETDGGVRHKPNIKKGMSKSQLKRAKMKANAAKKADEEAKKAAEQEAARQEELAKKNDLSDPAVVARKIKALSKKLRQLNELKEKQASGAELNEDQLQKLAQEEELNQEMEQLTLLAKE